MMMDARCASSPRRCFVASSPPCACSMARNRPVRSMATSSARRVLPSGSVESSPSAPQPCAIQRARRRRRPPRRHATRRQTRARRAARSDASRGPRARASRRSRRAHARRGVVRASARRRGERRARDPSEPAHRARPAVGLARNRRLRSWFSRRGSPVCAGARFQNPRFGTSRDSTASAPIKPASDSGHGKTRGSTNLQIRHSFHLDEAVCASVSERRERTETSGYFSGPSLSLRPGAGHRDTRVGGARVHTFRDEFAYRSRFLKGVRIARRDASAVERRREDRFRLRKDPLDRPVRVRSTLRFERRRERRVGRFLLGSGCVGRDVGSRGGAHRALRARNRGQTSVGASSSLARTPAGAGFPAAEPGRRLASETGAEPLRGVARALARRRRARGPERPRRVRAEHQAEASRRVVAAAVSVPSVQTVEDEFRDRADSRVDGENAKTENRAPRRRALGTRRLPRTRRACGRAGSLTKLLESLPPIPVVETTGGEGEKAEGQSSAPRMTASESSAHLRLYETLVEHGRLHNALELLRAAQRGVRNLGARVSHKKFLRQCARREAVAVAFEFVAFVDTSDVRVYNMLLSACAKAGDARGLAAFDDVRRGRRTRLPRVHDAHLGVRQGWRRREGV